jgi:hypothetical protein
MRYLVEADDIPMTVNDTESYEVRCESHIGSRYLYKQCYERVYGTIERESL